MKIISSKNSPEIINGIKYTGHALDQMQGRGLTPMVIEDAIQNGYLFPTQGNTIGYYKKDNNVRVIMGLKTKNVITVIPGAPPK